MPVSLLTNVVCRSELTNTMNTHNKVYHLILFLDKNDETYKIFSFWGRRGDKTVKKDCKRYSSRWEQSAKREFYDIIRSKERKGYVENEGDYEINDAMILAALTL